MSASMKFCKFLNSTPKSKEGPNAKPIARSGHRMVTTESDLYAVGGYNKNLWEEPNELGVTNYPLFRELWQFNFASRKWRKLDALDGMPFTLASHSAVLYGSSLIMFGGTSVPFGETSSNDVDVCNLHTLKWQHLDTSGEQPIPSYGVGMCTFDNYVYVCGGTTGWEYNIDVLRLDLRSKEWEWLEAQHTDKSPHFCPHERYRHEIITDGERLYVFGGGRSSIVFSFSEVPTFHIEKRVWQKLSTKQDPVHGYPVPRRCHGCTKLNDDIYICGGYNGVDIYGDLWALNLVDFCWRKYDSVMPEPAYFIDASITPHGCLYIFGGVTKLDVERTAEIYSIQLKIPSLKEMCWYTLTHTIPNIEKVPQTTLIQLGVPRDLINRIKYDEPASTA